MEGSILLLLVLFIAGLFTKNLPTKKLFAWFITICVKNPSSFTPSGKTSNKEKSSNSNKMSKKDEIMTRVFATFDKNSDGFITQQEMRLSLKNIGMDMEDKEIEEMIKNVDINGDGLIDINEFRESFEMLLSGKEMSNNINKENEKECKEDGSDEKAEERDLLKEAFDVFDEDKDGLITVEELSLILASMGFKEAVKVEDCKKMISSVDMDEDGMVNFDEFKKMMGSGQGFMQVS